MTIAALVAGGPLRMGATGSAVFAVQTALRAQGAQLVADLKYGVITAAAVMRFQLASGLKATGEVDLATAQKLDKVKAAPAEQVLTSSLVVAPHLSIMRAITGTKEFPGAANNPAIIGWAAEIVKRYPATKAGVGWYKTDSTAWCGLGGAYCLAMSGQKPPDAPLYVLNWRTAPELIRLSQPTLGAIGILERTGGGHLTMYEGEDRAHWYGRGCNQSDAVNVATFELDRKVTWHWPKGLPRPTTGRVNTTFANAVAAAREA
jgi:uncharacterized protein (TIGR02594 family)